MTGLPKPLTLYPRETLNKRQLQKALFALVYNQRM